jgi:hypothetical protein
VAARRVAWFFFMTILRAPDRAQIVSELNEMTKVKGAFGAPALTSSSVGSSVGPMNGTRGLPLEGRIDAQAMRTRNPACLA